MSGTAGKFRAIFFAAIMVTSMIAAGVAFTGNAAAANTAGNSSVSPLQVPADSTNDHTFTLNASDINTSGNGDQVFSVRFSDADAVDLSSSEVTAESVNDGSVSINSSKTNIDDTNDVVNLTLEDNGGSSSDTVSVTFNVTNVTANSSSDSSDIQFGVDANADGDLSGGSDAPYADIGTLTIGAGSVTPDTFVRAQVTDQAGNSVSTANTGVTVDVINSSGGTDTVVQQDITLNDQGRTESVPVNAGENYTIELNGGGTATLASASTVTPAAGETLEIDVTIQRVRQADQLEVDDITPTNANAQVNSDVQFDLLANDTNTLSNGPTGPVSGTVVDVTIESASNSGAVTLAPSSSNTTNQNGIAGFNVSSSVPQTVTLEFALSDNASINTTETATFGAVRANNTISGQVRTNDTEQFSGATVYAAATGSNQSLSFSEENRPFAVDTTTESGDYVLEDLQPDTQYNVYVVADGFNRIPETQTASEITGFVAKNQSVRTDAGDGDTTTADLVIEPSDAVFEYELDLTLTDASPDESSTLSDKSARIPSSGSVTAEVDVDRRRVGSTGMFSDAPAGVSVDIEPTSTGILDPNSQTVDTDSSGTATVSLDGQTAGTSNITANVTNVEDTDYNTTGSEQAQVEVFGIAEITGQVVNEDQQALSGGQANVTLEVENSTTGSFEPTGREVQIDDDGRYNFLNVESGQSYRLTASTEGGDTGSAVIDSISTGTTTRDIVVVGAEPLASVAFDNETAASGETTVTVDSADLPDGGFVVIHDANLTAGAGAVESVIGNSVYLEPGVNEDVEITLDRELTENQTLVAMAHRDTDGDETFDFVSSDGSTDGPYTAQGQAVTDSAEVTITESSLDGTAAEYDSNEDGEITASELGNAVTDFGEGGLTASELGDVVTEFGQS